MANTLVIDWKNLDSFTIVPVEISSICKYDSKKLSMDHKIIYSYLAKLDVDRQLNNTGYASFDFMMQRFGYGSKGSLAGYMQHLIDVGLLSKSETKKGQRNIYTVHPIDLDKVSYGSKSHMADSNKNKRAEQTEPTTPESKPEKVNNYPIAKKYRGLYADNAAKLKEFERLQYKASNDGLQLTPDLVARHMNEWESQQQTKVVEDSTPVYQREFTPSVFVDERDQSAYVENDNFDSPEEEHNTVSEPKPVMKSEIDKILLQLAYIPRDEVAEYKNQLVELGNDTLNVGILCNAMKSHYFYNDQRIETSPVVACAAIRALSETHLYEKLTNRGDLEQGLSLALSYVKPVHGKQDSKQEVTASDNYDFSGEIPF